MANASSYRRRFVRFRKFSVRNRSLAFRATLSLDLHIKLCFDTLSDYSYYVILEKRLST